MPTKTRRTQSGDINSRHDTGSAIISIGAAWFVVVIPGSDPCVDLRNRWYNSSCSG